MPFPFKSEVQRYWERRFWNLFIFQRQRYRIYVAEQSLSPYLSASYIKTIFKIKASYLVAMTENLITYDRMCTGRSSIGKGEYNA